MRNPSTFGRQCRGIGLAALLLAGTTIGAVARPIPQNPKPKKPGKEAFEALRKWADGEVRSILRPDEAAAYKKLKSDEEREAFIDIFWQLRDPDPDTPENEYREEFYRRVAYANEKFTSGKPGWLSDRGRIYITWGPPDSIESHPAGGPYERPVYEGGGSTSTYPFETWFYRHLEGIGSGVEIEFVDPSGSGEYRIAQNADEKDALLFVPGAGATLAEQLGFSTKPQRPFFSPGNRNNGLFQGREQDSEFSRMERTFGLLSKAPIVNGRGKESVEQSVEFDVLPFDVRTDFFRAGDSSVATTFTFLFSNQDLGFRDESDLKKAQLNISVRLTGLNGKRVGVIEESPVIAYQNAQFETGRSQNSIFQKRVVLPAGNYKVDVVVRDVTSGHMGIVKQGFEVPKYSNDSMTTSSLILADIVEPMKQASASSFIIGTNKVRPSVTQRFKRDQNLGLYLQVYNVQIDQTTLQPAIDVEYVISKAGKELARFREDGKGGVSDLSGYGQQLVLGRTIPLKDFEPGAYEVQVVLTDRVARKTLTPKTHFTVE